MLVLDPPLILLIKGEPQFWQFAAFIVFGLPQRLHVITFAPHFRQVARQKLPDEVYHSLLSLAS